MVSDLNQNKFDFIFLGQSVLKYQVPLDVYNTINHIYETKYPELKPANKPTASINVNDLNFINFVLLYLTQCTEIDSINQLEKSKVHFNVGYILE